MAKGGFRPRSLLKHLFAPELPPDFLDLCEQNVRHIQDLAYGRNLLNQKQCLDLLSKISQTTLNIRELVVHSGASVFLFEPALENLFRCLEKAKVLVTNCGEDRWLEAAVFQIQNENEFQEILLEVSLCYNVIYEQAKSMSEDWNHESPDDLRQRLVSPVFVPAIARYVQEDRQNLQQRLEKLAFDPSTVGLLGRLLSEKVTLKAQSLAKYLLLRMHYASEQSQANTLVAYSAILWTKDTEPPGTWGTSRFLGAGSGASGVCSTTWLGIPCAKKEFHERESESLFLKEAGILAHLKHPCIVNFICCGNGLERGDRFIATELMEMNLRDLIWDQQDAYFSVPVVVDIIVQIARGMWYLHDQGVAHRDLKPHNVVLNRLTYSPNIQDQFVSS